jgi:hypothetical protein
MSVKVAVGERHMRSTFKMTAMTCEYPRAWKRMEKWGERRLAVRALGLCIVIGRRGGDGSRRPVPVERDSRVSLFEHMVETSRFSKERVRLRDWRLLVGIAVHLESRLHFVRKGRGKGYENGEWGQHRPRRTRSSRRCRKEGVGCPRAPCSARRGASYLRRR